MRTKTIVTTVLLAFVALSMAVLIIKESRSGDSKHLQRTGSNIVTRDTRGVQPHKVVVYYFHGTSRCPTCLRIEALSRKALESGFGALLDSGKLEWHVVNVDKPENTHYVQDYELVSKSLVVADVENGRQKRWKNLQRIWELVGNKEAFLRYVQEEVKEYLGDAR